MSSHVPTFRTAGFDASESARRCLALIERCAPQYMVGLGMGIEGAGSAVGHGQRLPTAIKERIVELRRSGRLVKEIAALLEVSPPTVRHYCGAAGLSRYDRRKGRA